MTRFEWKSVPNDDFPQLNNKILQILNSSCKSQRDLTVKLQMIGLNSIHANFDVFPRFENSSSNKYIYCCQSIIHSGKSGKLMYNCVLIIPGITNGEHTPFVVRQWEVWGVYNSFVLSITLFLRGGNWLPLCILLRLISSNNQHQNINILYYFLLHNHLIRNTIM